MLVRLAFAVMIQVDADILLIDEVLAVGDAAFQQKCYEEFAAHPRGRRHGTARDARHGRGPAVLRPRDTARARRADRDRRPATTSATATSRSTSRRRSRRRRDAEEEHEPTLRRRARRDLRGLVRGRARAHARPRFRAGPAVHASWRACASASRSRIRSSASCSRTRAATPCSRLNTLATDPAARHASPPARRSTFRLSLRPPVRARPLPRHARGRARGNRRSPGSTAASASRPSMVTGIRDTDGDRRPRSPDRRRATRATATRSPDDRGRGRRASRPPHRGSDRRSATTRAGSGTSRARSRSPTSSCASSARCSATCGSWSGRCCCSASSTSCSRRSCGSAPTSSCTRSRCCSASSSTRSSSEATSGALTSLVDRENLIRKIDFPRLAVPMASVLTALFNLRAEPAWSCSSSCSPRAARSAGRGSSSRSCSPRSSRSRPGSGCCSRALFVTLPRHAPDLGRRAPGDLLRVADLLSDRRRDRAGPDARDGADVQPVRGDPAAGAPRADRARATRRRPRRSATRHCC